MSINVSKRKYQCDLCDEEFGLKEALAAHKDVHHMEFKCDEQGGMLHHVTCVVRSSTPSVLSIVGYAVHTAGSGCQDEAL